MPETNGITSHSHADSHNVTKCLHSEETIQKKPLAGNIKEELPDQSTEDKDNSKESDSFPQMAWRSFPHTVASQAKNMLAKGIEFFKKLTADNRQTPSTELLQEALIEKSVSSEENSKNMVVNTIDIGAELKSKRAKEQFRKPGKNTRFIGQKRKKERQLLEGTSKNTAVEDNYLLDSYNKNGEYTRIKAEENSFNYRR